MQVNTQAEYDLIIERQWVTNPVTGAKVQTQRGEIRTGYTREQAVRMFARREAVSLASRTPYIGANEKVKVGIDNIIADGFTEVIELPRGLVVLRNIEGESYSFRYRVEADYIRVLFDLGELARNY